MTKIRNRIHILKDDRILGQRDKSVREKRNSGLFQGVLSGPAYGYNKHGLASENVYRWVQ